MVDSGAPRKRARPALSCQECKRRKVKCDRAERCNQCTRTEVPCIYTAYISNSQGGLLQDATISSACPRIRTSTSPEEPLATRHVGDQPEANFQPINSQHVASAVASDGSRLNQSGAGTSQAINSPLHQNLLDRIIQLEKALPKAASDNDDRPTPTNPSILRQSRLHGSELIFTKTRISRWSDWMGINEQFAPVYACYTEALGISNHSSWQDASLRSIVDRIRDLLQKCKVLSRSAKRQHLSHSPIEIASSLEPPAREVADRFVHAYFQHFESTYRILHIPSFFKIYQDYWCSPASVSTPSLLQIRLVIALGSALICSDEVDIGFHNLVRRWVCVAEEWLAGPVNKDQLNLTALQVHCLLILARQVLSVGGDLVWISMGSVVHKAMQIGLHRDPQHLPQMSLLQAELRRRLWLTIMEMVVQASLDSAMPPRISFTEFDTLPPLNINDDELTESTVEIQQHHKNTFTSTSIQLLLHSSFKIRLQALQMLTSLSSDLHYHNVLDLTTQIHEACTGITRLFNAQHPYMTQFHNNLLDYMVRRFIIPLHCPFVVQDRSSPLFHYSIKTSLDAAIAIMTPKQDSQYSHFLVGGHTFFKEAIRLATTIISLELFSQIKEQQDWGTLHCQSQAREQLKRALQNGIEMAAARLLHGETNVKSHFFLSMILAHAEALEMGKSPETAVAKRGLESLELCHGLVSARFPDQYAELESCVVDENFPFGADLDDFNAFLDF